MPGQVLGTLKRETMMLKKCPRCGVQYTKEALEMFETTVKAGFTINLTCGNCGAAMVVDESQVGSGRSPKTAVPASSSGTGCAGVVLLILAVPVLGVLFWTILA